MKLKFQQIKKFYIVLTIIYYLSSNYTVAIPIAIATQVAVHGYQVIIKIKELTDKHDQANWRDKVTESLSEILHTTRKIETSLSEEADRIIEEITNKIDMQEVHNFQRVVHTINEKYKNRFMEYFVVKGNTYQNETIHNFIDDIIDEAGFRTVLRSLSEFIIPQGYVNNVPDKRLFDFLLEYQKIRINHHEDCNEALSHHQQLFAVYNLAIHTLVRGYTMVVHAYKYRQLEQHNPNAWVSEINHAIREYEETVLGIITSARQTMDKASYEIRRCDPDNFVEDVNYIRLKHFLSAIVVAPYIMCQQGEQRTACENYRRIYMISTSNPNLYEYECHGPVYDCWKVRISKICLGEHGSDRRYEALVEESNIFNLFKEYPKGDWSKRCERDHVKGISVPVTGSCEVCACICDGINDSRTVRAISLREHYTDFHDGKVVTGIRIKRTELLIHLEIQEGKLINGSVDPSTVKWNPNANYPPKTGPETFRLDYNTRSLNLDDIRLPAGFAVTGVKFASINGVLSLVVSGVKIVDESGNAVTPQEPEWYWPKKSTRSRLELVRPYTPTREKKRNIKSEQSGQHYIEFGVTGWSEDASQTVVPYIDSQEIVSDPPAPIGGVGMFFKNYERSGGFISLRIFSADYSIYLNKERLHMFFEEYKKYKN